MSHFVQATLSPAEESVVAAIEQRVHAAIAASGGWLRFDRYMQIALYEPGLGYYSGGAEKFGTAGDFTTAPELSNLFADSLAGLFVPLLEKMRSPRVLELGAGTGRLAARLLDVLRGGGMDELEYLILEPSADLRQRQQGLLGTRCARVRWLDALPSEPIEGIVFGNEVADALPVTPFVIEAGRAVPLGVVVADGRMAWQPGAPDAELDAAVAGIEHSIGYSLPEGYRSEVCLVLPAWISSLAACVRRGALLLIDYGLARRDYYHPDRCSGTLICHFRHRAHVDPFLLPGLQDITAWVDFSACADAATAAGLSIHGFTTQGQFLVESLTRRGPTAITGLSPGEQSAAKTLLLPGEMGERFKLLLAGRGIDAVALPGRDFRAWL